MLKQDSLSTLLMSEICETATTDLDFKAKDKDNETANCPQAPYGQGRDLRASISGRWWTTKDGARCACRCGFECARTRFRAPHTNT